jgi:hypothetical protein
LIEPANSEREGILATPASTTSLDEGKLSM